MKKIIAIIFASSILLADQYELISLDIANKSKKLLDDRGYMIGYCEPCGEKNPSIVKINTMQIKPEEGNNYVLEVNGKNLDLAYTYIKISGLWKNLALYLGLNTEGVANILDVNNEIHEERNLYSNGYIPAVKDIVQAQDSIQAVNILQEDTSIRSLFDAPKITNIKPQKLALASPAKIADKQKPTVQVKKSAAEPESTIQAIGYGNSEDEALKGAYQNAVEQYVGVLVDSSTIIRNDRLIKNDILTFSNGYIESYKKLSSKEQMGLWEVKIDAVIKKQNVLEKIKALNIDPIDIKDSEQTYAKVVSQVQSKFDAEDMIVKLVKETNIDELSNKYTKLRVDSVDLDLDMATRKSVPVTITYSKLFNWDEYLKVTNKFEKLFENIGGKLVGTQKINNQSDFYQDWSRRTVRDAPAPRDAAAPREYTDDLIISVIVKRNNKMYKNFWLFPKSFAVIYPFSSTEETRYMGDCKFWDYYSNDGKRSKIYGDKRIRQRSYDRYYISISDIKGQLVWNNKGDTMPDFHHQFILDDERDETPSISPNVYSLDSTAPFIEKASIKINLDIDKIKDLKQVKILWDKERYEHEANDNE
jgi:hypothetical protein